MQNLRPFVAKCYRGGRSSGNRQFRGFSSSSPTDLPKIESLMIQVAWRVGLSSYLIFKAVEGTVSLQDVKVAEDLAAEKGKKIAFRHNLNFFKPNKLQVVFYDDVDSRHPVGEITNERVPLADSFYMKEGQRARCMRQALDRGAELTDSAAATGKKVAIAFDLSLFKPSTAQAAWESWSENGGIDLLDQDVADSCHPLEVGRCVQIGLLCVQHQPADRPNTLELLSMLTTTSDLPSPRQPTFAFHTTDDESLSNDLITVNGMTQSVILAR